MTSGRLQQIREVFESIIELNLLEREIALREMGADDPDLVFEVKRLVSAYDRRGGFIEQPIANLKQFLSLPDREPERTGKVAGAYHLLRLIGEGGMGEVWYAEQRFPVRRHAAVKLIKAGMDTREVVARFESERQALALMDHPAIAKVFDAGSTPEGRPYFAMECVTGIPITRYCDEHRLTTRERLELFVRVCEGVQHAHQKAIIHRDLKPSNILVTEVDGRAMPKIIDFGVAKAVSQPLAARPSFTRVGAIIGTPDYMSPEQAYSAGEDIDTRTDVYSLGVVLYELLTGALPFDSRKLALHEVLRMLRESNTPPPSTKLRTHNGQSTAFHDRRTEPAALLRQLRGDLDAITLKALEKDRGRRYGSPADLASDIERYLRNEPVTARASSVRYQAWKYARRHRGAVAVAALAILLLATFGIVEGLQLRRITRERDRADRITNFMVGMFNVSNPTQSLGSKITAREILDKASKDVGAGLADDPELQAEMMFVMGKVYYNLGLFSQAESLFDRTLKTRRRILGRYDSKTTQSMTNLANALYSQGRLAPAEKLDREVVAIRQRVYGANHPDTLRAMNNLAILLAARGGEGEAIELHRTILDAQRRVLGPEHSDTLLSMANLAIDLVEAGQYAEGENLEREVLGVQSKRLGPRHLNTLDAMEYLSWALYYEGRYSEAEKLNREALEGQRRILGPLHAQTLMAMDSLGQTLDGEGRYREAEELLREGLDLQRRVLGPEHPDTLYAMTFLGAVLADEGQYEQAEKLQRQAAETRSRVLGPNHPRTLYSISRLAGILILRGHFDEAEKLSRATREKQLRILGPEHPDTAASTYNLASIAVHTGSRDQALAELRRAIDHGLRPNAAMSIGKDRALQPLHADARFQTLVSYARRHAATQGH